MKKRLIQFLGVLVLTVGCGIAAADPIAGPVGTRAEPMPSQLQGVGVDEHRDALLPLNLPFMDEDANRVTLAKYFKGDRPVILQLGYLDCPMLCGLVSQGTMESLKQLNLEMGKDYEFLFVDINPSEGPELAYKKKQNYIQEYGNRGDPAGWHFLTGKKQQIQDLARTVGFRYKWVDSQSQFSHAAVIMICTPDGRVSQYLYGVTFPSKTLRLSLVDASNGKIGTAFDQIMLFCSMFDPSTGRYTWAAYGLLRIAGVMTMLALGSVWVWQLLRSHKERKLARKLASE